jgi:hypothetical protein
VNELSIVLANRDGAYRPGDVVEGKAVWDLHREPNRARVLLLWKTSGKGDTDTETIDLENLRRPDRHGELPFRFELPEGPYSFSGKLISLHWLLRLEAEPEKPYEQEIVVSPTLAEIELGKVGDGR